MEFKALLRNRSVYPSSIALWVFCFSSTLFAQKVPTDLLDLSIEELFDANVITDSERAISDNRWHVSYTNYPVVPTEIKQEVHALRVAYDLTDAMTVRAQLPMVKQSTDHISIVPGYDAFNISSDGVGDLVVVFDRTMSQSLNSVWKAGLGVSVPTGSIDEEGDTPRAPGNQQLPYTMQLGSGTWDFPIFLSFRKYEARWDWGLDASFALRTGKNDRDYRLGNKASVGGWVMWNGFSAVKPGIRLDYRWRDDIHGEDASLRVPIPGFPYPAPVTNPNAFGGEQVDVTGFLRVPFADKWYAEVSYARPVFLDLNGPQSSEKYHFSIEIGTSF